MQDEFWLGRATASNTQSKKLQVEHLSPVPDISKICRTSCYGAVKCTKDTTVLRLCFDWENWDTPENEIEKFGDYATEFRKQVGLKNIFTSLQAIDQAGELRCERIEVRNYECCILIPRDVKSSENLKKALRGQPNSLLVEANYKQSGLMAVGVILNQALVYAINSFSFGKDVSGIDWIKIFVDHY